MAADSNSLRNIAKNLNDFKISISNEWQAEEITYICKAIENINSQLFSLALNIESINSDIVQVAQEIRREDEAKAAAERLAHKSK